MTGGAEEEIKGRGNEEVRKRLENHEMEVHRLHYS